MGIVLAIVSTAAVVFLQIRYGAEIQALLIGALALCFLILLVLLIFMVFLAIFGVA